jgi:hypothetical protein
MYFSFVFIQKVGLPAGWNEEDAGMKTSGELSEATVSKCFRPSHPPSDLERMLTRISHREQRPTF